MNTNAKTFYEVKKNLLNIREEYISLIEQRVQQLDSQKQYIDEMVNFASRMDMEASMQKTIETAMTKIKEEKNKKEYL